uniref:Uncharacterized protein n=1 Tax=Arundo donax TaxID=35708 RepID=A0A0A9FWK2_ARUDO
MLCHQLHVPRQMQPEEPPPKDHHSKHLYQPSTTHHMSDLGSPHFQSSHLYPCRIAPYMPLPYKLMAKQLAQRICHLLPQHLYKLAAQTSGSSPSIDLCYRVCMHSL